MNSATSILCGQMQFYEDAFESRRCSNKSRTAFFVVGTLPPPPSAKAVIMATSLFSILVNLLFVCLHLYQRKSNSTLSCQLEIRYQNKMLLLVVRFLEVYEIGYE